MGTIWNGSPTNIYSKLIRFPPMMYKTFMDRWQCPPHRLLSAWPFVLQYPIVNIEDRTISITNTNIYIFLYQPVIAPASSHSITPSRVQYFPVLFFFEKTETLWNVHCYNHFKILVENSHDRMFTHFISIFAFGYEICRWTIWNYMYMWIFILTIQWFLLLRAFFKETILFMETQDKSFLSVILYI